MEIFGNLPTWAVVLLSVLAAAVLVVLNIGWLLQAKGLLEGYSRKREERERAARQEIEAQVRAEHEREAAGEGSGEAAGKDRGEGSVERDDLDR